MGRKGQNKPAKTASNKSHDDDQDEHGVIIANPHIVLAIIIVGSILTRLYNIHEPDHVCWDETHFGKMASWYLNHTFFFDVHPPLGKMMIALSGHLSGYDGRFAFDKPGDKYENWTQYVGMRVFCAFMGLAIPIAIYKATKSMSKSNLAAETAALLVLFDNGLITLTRYILLDPPLLFFIAMSIVGMAEVSFNVGPEDRKRSFTMTWWFWMIWTGISIACSFSVKFVGLFIVLTVGFRTAYDLWIILSDDKQSIIYFIKHFAARVICLIALPVCLYIAFFAIHLKQLNHSGSGDGFYSSSFQSQLVGNSLHNSSWPAHLAYGAEVTIKNNRIGGAYLHSHWHLYPEGVGARQQQVTTYSHKDSNNKWIVKPAMTDIDPASPKIEFVRDGDLIRLEHVVTKRNLHSHYEVAPITKRHFQVTCYGEGGIGDANDIWRIQKDQYKSQTEEDDRIYTVKTRFRLIHYLTNCALYSHNKQLPKWAYDQLEVTCSPRLHDKNNFWNIEDNSFSKLPNVSFEEYAPSFIERFSESHAVMLQGNAGLKPKEGEVTSRPWQWPLNYRGQFFSASKEHKIYLLGNPLTWWVNIAAIPLTLILIIVISISRKISSTAIHQTERIGKSPIEENYLHASVWVMLGWIIHYVPFYFMGRILYFHHYFPAFLFSCMLTAITFDYSITVVCSKICGSSKLARRLRSNILIPTIAMIVYTYFKFTPITYGIRSEVMDSSDSNATDIWKNEQKLSSLKWLDSWEF